MTEMVRVEGRFPTVENAVLFIDAFNEWARHPDIDALFSRTDDTPTGYPESDYAIARTGEK